MALFRIIGGWILLAAIIALVADVTQAYQTGAKMSFASLGKEWSVLSPASLDLVQTSIEWHLHPLLWDPGLMLLLKLPAFAVLGAAGIALYAVGLRRRGTNIFAN
jgi:hypothetical protein